MFAGLENLLRASAKLEAFFKSQGWKFCFIGVQRWGEPRFTKDADITLLTGFGGEERLSTPCSGN